MDEQQTLPPAPSLGSTISDVFVAPSECFQNLENTAPAPILWIAPLIASLLMVIFSVVVLFTNEILKTEMADMQSKAIQKMVDEGKLTQEQAEKSESMGSLMIVFSIVGGTVAIAAFFFGGALILWIANKTILHSAANYKKHMEMYGISSWIGVLGGIITIFMMIGLGSIAATPSAALAVLGNFDPSSNLHKLLSSLNILSIWQTAVVGIGLSKLSGKSTAAGVGLAFALWLVWVAVSVLLGFAR